MGLADKYKPRRRHKIMPLSPPYLACPSQRLPVSTAPATPSEAPRLLLCADAGHCAQVLRAAAAARVPLHGLQPHTKWPSALLPGTVVLWALVPTLGEIATRALEAQWRSRMLQGNPSVTLHMLYGEASQQAQQLAPWLAQTDAISTAPEQTPDDCWECLDGHSEQALFQHLLQHAAKR